MPSTVAVAYPLRRRVPAAHRPNQPRVVTLRTPCRSIVEPVADEDARLVLLVPVDREQPEAGHGQVPRVSLGLL